MKKIEFILIRNKDRQSGTYSFISNYRGVEMNREELVKLDEGVYITKERLANIDKLNEKYTNEIKKNHWAITGVIYEVPYLSDDEHYCRIWYSYKDLKTNKICEGRKEFIDSDTFDLTLQSVLYYLKNFDKEFEGKYSLIKNE